jgi:transcriptional regulator with XRE-family HTH domain
MTKDLDLLSVFSQRLVACREANGWSQAELAREMGTSSGFVCDYEQGRRNPTLETVQRFAVALRVKPVKLLK